MSFRIAPTAMGAGGSRPAGAPRRAELFAASAEAYDRFMGRYTPDLARGLADAAGIGSSLRVLDVGCGPGGLTAELAARVGAGAVAAIDPAPQFASACRARLPGVDVRVGVAEYLPWPTRSFDGALACLVLSFVDDPDRAVREMARVTRPGGVVAACVWDLAEGGMTMLRMFWEAMDAVSRGTADAASPGTADAALPGRARGDIATIFRAAGLLSVTDGALTSRASYLGFDDFWEPFTAGVGPAGHALAALPAPQRAAVRETCRGLLAAGPFTLTARAWYATGRVPPGAGREA